jgi:DNA-binding NarL/FixJ family response regulator
MTRVLLVDDHALVRHSLTQVLTQAAGITVVADAPDADRAIDSAIRHQPDVVVMDIDMPGVAAFDAASVIRARCPQARIVFLSAFTHDRYIQAALDCGAMGYVTKNESADSVIRAIRAAANGQTYFSPEVQSRLVIDSDGVRLSQTVQSRISRLSSREVEVLRYIALGHSKKEIAGLMHLSVKTIENHAASIMTALDIHDRVELTRFAIREGLVEP